MTVTHSYSLLGTLLQFVIYLTAAPGVIGVLHTLKSRLQGRAGTSPLQPYRDLWKLFHRRPVIPQDASWVFLSAPLIILGCYMLLGLVSPILMFPTEAIDITSTTSGNLRSLLVDMFIEPPVTDLLGVIFLISLARFVGGLAGLDANASFGGLGSGRELFFHVLAEPTLLMIVYALALKTHTSGILWLIASQQKMDYAHIPEYLGVLLVTIAFILVLLSEAGRIPFDNPSSHLELTMNAKAIHLEYGGPLLGMLELAEALRLTYFIALLTNLFVFGNLIPHLPPTTHWLLRAGIYFVIFVILIAALAWWELSRGKLALRASLGPAFIALALATVGMIILAVLGVSTG